LKGLEISIVKSSELDYSQRLDAEYYRPKYIKYQNTIKNKGGVELSTVSDFLIGPFGSAFTVENYTDDKTYRYIRGKDVKPMILMENDNVYMPEKDYNRLSKYALKENDILVSVVGTLGNAAIVESKNLPAIFSCKSTVLRVKNEVKSQYLVTYLNSKYGKELLLRKERGAIQKGLNLDDLKTMEVLVPSNIFQNQILEVFNLSKFKLKASKELYSQAEQLLLEELGLQDWQPSTENINQKSFKESFLATGRLDAEYYQLKYEDYHDLVVSYSNGHKPLYVICNLKDSNFIPKVKQRYKYIELSNIGISGEVTGCTVAEGNELPSRARRKVNTDDVIVSSIEGSLTSCALITKNYDNAICSTGFYVINSKEINSETLLVLFKSELMQNILKQNCSGTILTAVNKSEFQNIPVPLINKNIQIKTAELVKQSTELKQCSEHLLEVAKRAVEIAIEENEEVSLNYIKSNI
jgi:restriction endonuclease S subunit